MTTFDTVEPGDVRHRYTAAGWWSGETLADLLAGALYESRQRTFAAYHRHRVERMSLQQLDACSRRLAAGLRRIGVGPGDPVAFQLTNSLPAAAVFYGLAYAGAVLVPIGHAAGRSDVDHALRSTGARAFFLDAPSAGEGTLDGIVTGQSRPSSLEHVISIGAGSVPSSMLTMEALDGDEGSGVVVGRDPAAPAVIGWTSGSTAAPKGVLLSHRALAAEIRLHMSSMEAPRNRPMLSTSPVSHVTGMLISLLVPPLIGRDVHLMDFWEPSRVLTLMSRNGLSAGSGAPYFLQSLLDAPDCGAEHRALVEFAALGGAAVSRDLVERADILGVRAFKGYGCTEHPSISMGRASDPLQLRAETDGYPCTGVELRIRADDGSHHVTGTGEILTRGPDLFSGYVEPAMNAAVFDAGWYCTGDIGTVDERGMLTVVDRIKDIIIRAGLNISSAEVEASLASMPGIAEVAVVAAPDERTGERGCAFIRPEPGCQAPTLKSVQLHLAAQGLAKYKWPEDIRLHSAPLPRTPAGKVQKPVLREVARQPTEPHERRHPREIRMEGT